MKLKKLLIANRGEVAVRIARSAAECGIATTAVHAGDDAASLHATAADAAVALAGNGPAAYLDQQRLIAIAVAEGCDSVHPGYGFLSESAVFATAVEAAGLVFVGPAPATLDALGDKARAKDLARRLSIPIIAGTDGATSLAAAAAFQARQPVGGAVMVKAVAGGGGRGMRIVRDAASLAGAFERCRSEAERAFGRGDLYVERLVERVRHIEVQAIGDGSGAVACLGNRECTLQRRHQKLIEMAPAPALDESVGAAMTSAALAMAREFRLRSLATFEFLVEAEPEPGHAPRFFFIEANPRLQVEHTVTEAITGLDLVALQLAIAAGASLAALGLGSGGQVPAAVGSGFAIQLRVNAEVMAADGSTLPATGRVRDLVWPGGPGIRIDTHIADGVEIGGAYDSLLAKLVVASPTSDPGPALARARRALAETRIGGVATNIDLLRALLLRPEIVTGAATTGLIDSGAAKLVAAVAALPHRRHAERRVADAGHAGATAPAALGAGPDAVCSTLPGSIIAVPVTPGQRVARGATLAVIESMKMEHLVEAATAGIVGEVHVAAGDVVRAGQPLLDLAQGRDDGAAIGAQHAADPDLIRADLRAVIERHAFTLDASRPEAMARRHKLAMRSVRENIADLVDPRSFIEYGALAVAAQRRRRSLDDLIRNTPADGLITGIGTVNAARVGAERARAAIMAYDYTVLAGTQGMLNHKKSDRLLDLAEQWRLPIVLFAEGGGGRPGDVDWIGVAGLDVTTFHRYARLSGQVPRVGIVAGRCFAGNAALLGSSDVIIATANTSLGMGGPAMIEGGGLGVVAPDDVGPVAMQGPNGVIDVLVTDEAAAVAAAKQYLGFFQGAIAEWTAADQRGLRHLIPENRVRVYDVRRVIETLADAGSVLELRQAFGTGAITALVRIEGRPAGLIANNPRHLGGAIDAEACDKLARFLQLCDTFALPVVSLCDTPGFMVGVESEKTAMVRKTSRLFVTAAAMSVPVFTIVLRKGYGLGAQAMAAGTFHAPMFTVSWPTGEFGGMGLEGAVRLGFRKELAAAPEAERDGLFRDLVAKSYERGKALNMASHLEIDAVIDPAETRHWILRGLASLPARPPETGRRRFLDTW